MLLVHVAQAVQRFAGTSISKFSTKLKPAAGTKYGQRTFPDYLTEPPRRLERAQARLLPPPRHFVTPLLGQEGSTPAQPWKGGEKLFPSSLRRGGTEGDGVVEIHAQVRPRCS